MSVVTLKPGAVALPKEIKNEITANINIVEETTFSNRSLRPQQMAAHKNWRELHKVGKKCYFCAQ